MFTFCIYQLGLYFKTFDPIQSTRFIKFKQNNKFDLNKYI